MADTNISWASKVWNPIVGCTRVSPGCGDGPLKGGGCYAEAFAHRLEAMGQARYSGLTVMKEQGARWTGVVREVPEVLGAPLRWRKSQRIFVNSMSDLFHEKVAFEYIAAVFGVMAACPQHVFLVLTKRPARALEFFRWLENEARGVNGRRGMAAELFCLAHAQRNGMGAGDTFAVERRGWPLQSVHLGVSVEDQQRADERIPILLQCPAAVRWVSAEPLLERIDLNAIDATNAGWRAAGPWAEEPTAISAFGKWQETPMRARLQNGIDWVVVGGESGAGHRSVDPAWIDSIVAQCTAAGVSCFVKQDSGPKPGRQGRLSDATWARKEFP